MKRLLVLSVLTAAIIFAQQVADKWLINSSGAITPTGGRSITGSLIACVAAPGNTTGLYGSLCEVRTTGALWGCTNAAGCAVAADWAAAGGGNAVLPTNVKDYGAKGDGVIHVDGAMIGSDVTFTTSANPSGAGGFLIEYAGVNTTTPVDVFATNNGATTSPIIPSVTTTAANDLLVGVVGWTGPTITPNGTLTQRVSAIGTVGVGWGAWEGDKVIASSGTVTGTLSGTISNNYANWATLAIALKASGVSAPTFVGATSFANNNSNAINMVHLSNSQVGDVQIVCTVIGNETITANAALTLIALISNGGTHQPQVNCYSRVVTTAQYTLTSTAASFTSGDVGKLVDVAKVTTSATNRAGTIVAVTDGTHAVLSTTNDNVAAISGAEYIYLTNDDTAIDATITAACASTSTAAAIYFPRGVYGATAQHNVCPGLAQAKGIEISGAGAGIIDIWVPFISTPDCGGMNPCIAMGATPTTAIYWAANTVTGDHCDPTIAGPSGLCFGYGIPHATGADQFVQDNIGCPNMWRIRDIGLLSGIGANNGGGASTTGLYVNGACQFVADSIRVGGWGQGAAVFNTNWTTNIFTSWFDASGLDTITVLGSGQGGQNFNLWGSTVGQAQRHGLNISGVTPVSLIGNIIGSNGKNSGYTSYDVVYSGSQGAATMAITITSNWMEHNYNTTAAFNLSGAYHPLVSNNVMAGYSTLPFLVSGGGGTGAAVTTGSLDTSGIFTVGTTVTTGSILLNLVNSPGAMLPSCSALDKSTAGIFVQAKVALNVSTPQLTLAAVAMTTGTATNFTAGDVITWSCQP